MKRLSGTIAITLLIIALAFGSVACGESASGGADQAQPSSTAYAGTENNSNDANNSGTGAVETSGLTNDAKNAGTSTADEKQVKTVWYEIKDLNLAMEVPEDFRIKKAKKKGNFTGGNDRISITIERWNRVSYPKAKDLATLVKKVTGRKTKVVKLGGRRMVKVLGLTKSIRYFMVSPNGDDYVIKLKANSTKYHKIKFSEIRDEAETVVNSFRLSSRIPDGAKTASIRKTSFPKFNKLVLVNYAHKLPDGWMDKVDIVKAVNTRGNKVRAERTTYKAYLKLKHDLEENNGIHIDIDYGLRTVKEQQKIMKEYTEKYGAAYANRIVAKPGYSEHHTGLALDIYLIIDGKNVYLNEEMEKYPKIWAKIHKKLAKYGFILRYPQNGNGRYTGYAYESWHIRYVGKKAAKKIMDRQPGYTLEMYLS